MTTAITRSTCTSYFIIAPSSEGSSQHTWAIIALAEPKGTLLIYSEYGSWGYHWSHPGEDFRAFLCQVHDEYLIRKLTKDRDKHFNLEATTEAICDWIRQRGKMSPEDAEQNIRDVRDLADQWGHSPGLFLHHCMELAYMGLIYQQISEGDICVYEPDPQCVEFVRRLWPAFVAELKKEVGCG